MTTTTVSSTTAPSDRIRQVSVIVSAVIAIVGAFVGSGAAGGTPIQDAAGGALGANATILAPAGGAFSIWSVIYLGLVVYAVWQCLPSQTTRERQRRVGYWMVASNLLNAAWILSIQFGLLALSVPVIVALLVVLCCALGVLRREPGSGIIESIVLDGTVGLYLGWVMVATVANVTSLLTSAKFGGFGIAAAVWGIALLVVVALLGVGLAVWDRGRISPAVAIAWGVAWIGVSRVAGSYHSGAVGVTAFVVAGVVLVGGIVVRIVRAVEGIRGRSSGAGG